MYWRIIIPDVRAYHQMDGQGRPVIESSGALVVGNPQLMPAIAHHWHLKEIPGAEYEARVLGELLSCRPLIGPEATKGAVLHQIEQVGGLSVCWLRCLKHGFLFVVCCYVSSLDCG